MNVAFLLACYGLTAIIIESNLFPLRWLRAFLVWCKLEKLTRCYRCMGFWVALLFAILYYDDWLLRIIGAFAGSGTSYLLGKLVPNFSVGSLSDVVVIDENMED